MKTIICLALCALVVSATGPVDSLLSALDLMDMQHLLDASDCAFDLTASFTYLAGKNGDSDSDSDSNSCSCSSSDVSEDLQINGNYNLIIIKDGQSNITSNSFNKTKSLSLQGAVNITGSGTFSARGGGAEKKGWFNGGSSTDFTYNDGGLVVGVREHLYGGEFKDCSHFGQGFIQYSTWQGGVNSSSAGVEYKFEGSKKSGHELYEGKSQGQFEVTTDKAYHGYIEEFFHGYSSRHRYAVSGYYKVDAFNSDGDLVFDKSGPFHQKGKKEMIGGVEFMNTRFNQAFESKTIVE